MNIVTPPPSSRVPSGLADLVDGIGTEQFGPRLLRFLHSLCGADHCAVFQFGEESVHALTMSSVDPARASPMVERYVREALWREDPVLRIGRAQASGAATACASLIRLDLDDARYSALRPRIYTDVCDRMVVYGRRGSADFGLSVVRSHPHPAFEPEAIEHLAALSDTLIAAMDKHRNVLMHKSNVATALTDLVEIENCFAATTELPRRELEVCARILYGLSSTGISLDLGVGEESVKTYRKRAYQRLGIGCERELLHGYLARWSAWRGPLSVPTAVH